MNNDLKINIIGEDIKYLFHTFLLHKMDLKFKFLRKIIFIIKVKKNYYFYT